MRQVHPEPDTGLPDGLPFDPKEWAERVAEARVRREAVLAGRLPPPPQALPGTFQPWAGSLPPSVGRLAWLAGAAVLFTAGLVTGLVLAELTRRPASLPAEVAGLAPGPTLSLAALRLPQTAPEPAPEAAMLARAPAPADAPRRPAPQATPPLQAAPGAPMTLPLALGVANPQPPAAAAPEADGISPQLIQSLVEAAIAGNPEP